MADYSMWLLEFAHGKTQAWSWMVAGEHNKGVVYNVPFYYVLIQGEGHNILIDVGFDYNPRTKDMLEGFGVIDYVTPDKILSKIDLKPDDIDIVILTHAHFDHMGNMSGFPNATFYLQKRELFEWINWISLPERFQFLSMPLDPYNLNEAIDLIAKGRMKLVDGRVENLFPGITLLPAFDTHSFGLQQVSIEIGSDKGKENWVCVSDNAHEYENVEGIDGDGILRPVGYVTGSFQNTILALDEALQIAGTSDRLIIGHSQTSFDRFPSKVYPDGLRVAELALAEKEKSKIK